ncbi:hypothetical protein [Nocardia vaccinii]|uniref:hypothetical protein n=1 Tax=Nocardia vaccinii TaxID=1822 RepID=UPI0012F50C8E|nr:hypothetical protein [Nocardia vaccinii]
MPTLVLVPAVASLYFVTGCGPDSTTAGPESPITTSNWLTRTTTQTTQPATTPPLRSATPPSTPQTTTETTPPQSEDLELDADFAAVCANAVTGLRVDDSECDDATDDYFGDATDVATYAAAGLAGGALGAAMWYYFSVRNRVAAPAIGTLVRDGTYTTPYLIDGRPSVIYRTGSIDEKGGLLTKTTIHRGGLGLRPHSSHS